MAVLHDQGARIRPAVVIAAGALAVLTTLTSCSNVPRRDPGPTPAMTLSSCPDLRQGQHDPVGGRDCVRMLQQALRTHGFPQQPVTGRFRDVTAANVQAFQRAHGIQPVNGNAGPQTRRALTRAGDSPLEGLTTAAFTGAPRCAGDACQVYLQRSATARYGRWVIAHPLSIRLASDVLSAGTCRVLRLAKPVGFICELIGGDVISRIATQLTAAARQGACLRLTLSLPVKGSKLRLLDVSPHHSARCS